MLHETNIPQPEIGSKRATFSYGILALHKRRWKAHSRVCLPVFSFCFCFLFFCFPLPVSQTALSSAFVFYLTFLFDFPQCICCTDLMTAVSSNAAAAAETSFICWFPVHSAHGERVCTDHPSALHTSHSRTSSAKVLLAAYFVAGHLLLPPPIYYADVPKAHNCRQWSEHKKQTNLETTMMTT